MYNSREESKNGLCLLITALILGIFLFAFSWSSIDPLFYGLKCNVFSKNCQASIYSNGRYMIGPLNYFIEFPANLKSIGFSSFKNSNAPPLKTRTKEGQPLGLHVSF